MFIDEVVISVKAGDGGDGAVSFRREKYVPKGGPDGGDGGHGGDVQLVASTSTHGLAQFKGKKHYQAQDGERGMKKNCHGGNADDLILSVPPGTRIFVLNEDGSERLLSDLVEEDKPITIARGGRGGKGNWHFRSATNQTPLEFEPGTKGRSATLRLELQLIADVGLIGMPNAGKSTLLSVISNARPKIANYAFTTLAPQLGMVTHRERQFVAADLPGLIEGAAEGKGLGHEFLRHVQRTSVLVHLITAADPEPEKTYETVRQELSTFDPLLVTKPEIVVLSQIDLEPDWEKYHAEFIEKHNAFGISATSHTGLTELLDAIVAQLPE